DAVAYRYAGRISNGAHLVYERPYEGDVWLLVAGGDSIVLPGPPLASPSGQALAAAAGDVVFRQSGLSIVERRDGAAVLVAQFAEVPYPCDLRWVSDDELSFQASTSGEGQAPSNWGV